VKRIY